MEKIPSHDCVNCREKTKKEGYKMYQLKRRGKELKVN